MAHPGMRYLTFEESDEYPIALLIKSAAFHRTEIENAYVRPLGRQGIEPHELLAITLAYNDAGKAPAKYIQEYLEELLPALDSVGTKFLYCADAEYFKRLTKERKAEPHLGYVLDCKWPGYEHMKVVYGINHKSLIYNPANEGKMLMSLRTLITAVEGNQTDLGQNIIHSAYYPDSPEAIKQALDALHEYPALSVDIEAFSLDFDKAGIGTITFAWGQHDGIAFACDYRPLLDGPDEHGNYGHYVPNSRVRALLKEFFTSYKGRLRWHRATYDLKPIIAELWMTDLLDYEGMLEGLDVMTKNYDDTRIVAYLALNSTAGNDLSLKELAHPFAGNWAHEEIKDIRKIPLPDLLEYNLIDGLSTNYVYDTFYPQMVHDQQDELYYGLMMPSQTTIVQMEMVGMPLCPKRVQAAREELEGILAEQTAILRGKPDDPLKAAIMPQPIRALEARLQQEAMEAANAKLKIKQHPLSAFSHVEFNPNSGPQKQKLLYDIMQLPVLDRTDSGQPATGGDTLAKLINHTDSQEEKGIIQALIDHAQAAKVLSAFIPAFEEAIAKGDHSIVWLHGNFNLGGTKSGRLSSSDPNMQNIPAGSRFGKLIKSCFMAPEGWLFCGADFNSLEDYISALTTKDPNKLKVYLEGYDGHSLRAYTYWPDKFPDIVNTVESINSIKKLYEKDRSDSKAPTFALTYQGTYHTLMTNCGFPEDEAKAVEANFQELYKVSIQWVQDKLDEARDRGYVEVAFGLRLRTPLLAKTVKGVREPYAAKAEGRTAGNALGQSYGLLTNRACMEFMHKVWESPYRTKVMPVAMIHDAIYLIIANDMEVVEWVNRELIGSMQWQELPEIQHDKVKLGAELDIFYPSWAEAMTVPNDADQETIENLCVDHMNALAEKQAA